VSGQADDELHDEEGDDERERQLQATHMSGARARRRVRMAV
jgi:hypothetical protein